jgi:ribosomal protein L12E/L44/L45/RPP1/RPP2
MLLCQHLSSEDMKRVQEDFVCTNRNATIEVLLAAITTEVNGKNIDELL